MNNTSRIIDGSALAQKLKNSLAGRARALCKSLNRPPSLAIISTHPNAAADAYLQSRIKACRAAGISAKAFSPSGPATTTNVLRLLRSLALADGIDALIIDFPLPRAVDTAALLDILPSRIDAEGISTQSYGRLFSCKTMAEIQARGIIAPPTALAAIALLKAVKAPLTGRHAVVVGRSSIVGRPTAHLLSALDATVTLAHSRTPDLAGEVRRADIVVACAGRPRLIRGSWLKKGAVVIDAGMNPAAGGFCGDVHFEEAAKVASHITPVPGGVGPVTTALLLANVLALAEAKASTRR